jgi:hypothetical protein
MTKAYKRWFGIAPLFEPNKGTTVIEPLSSGSGWWAGAPSVLYDDNVKKFYLYYRIRKPRELGRGTNCFIAESNDGVEFKTIWEASKEDLNTASMEKAAMVKTLDGRFRLYISFVDPEDNKCSGYSGL